MPITDSFVMPGDVVIMPITELSAEVREKVKYKDGDFAITRPRARTPSKIIDAEAAALLKEFQTAKTIVAAIISYSRTTGADTHQTLEAALPLLKHFIDARLLVTPDSAEAEQIMPNFVAGDMFDEFEIRASIQIVEDSELYQARSENGDVALKILRSTNRPEMDLAFEREVAVLKHLDGKVNPRLVKHGRFENKLYIAIEWISGVPLTVVADEWRNFAPNGDDEQENINDTELRARLKNLCVTLIESYAHLHAQGVIHSDVHPRNLLVNAAGEVKILDFGLARFADAGHELNLAARGGVGIYYEPEFVEAIMTLQIEPQSSMHGEQFSVATILYQLLSGANYLDFSLEQKEMYRQIVEDAPLPFAHHNCPAWQEMEEVLAKALNKDSRQRFASMQEFARALSQVALPQHEHNQAEQARDESAFVHSKWTITQPHATATLSSTATTKVQHQTSIIESIIERLQADNKLFQSEVGGENPLPTCAVNYGVAGIAYALYRVACVRDDSHLLALADLWATKALADATSEAAFYNPRIEASEETVGKVSLYHTASGVHCVRALVSSAMGDALTHQNAVENFILVAQQECENLDLTLGRSGVLLGCALLAENERRFISVPDAPLLQLGDDVMRGIWEKINSYDSVRVCAELNYLGMAHGWAGVLFAILRWCQIKAEATRTSLTNVLPGDVRARLDQLGQCAIPIGRGSVWHWQNSWQNNQQNNRQNNESNHEPAFMSGWCNGSAGYVHLWTLADTLFDDSNYLNLAQHAAWSTWEQHSELGNLCCGLTGRSYALLNFYQHTGERDWLYRARDLAHRAIFIEHDSTGNDAEVNGLYKGDVGLCVLLADLNRPAEASLPLFERER